MIGKSQERKFRMTYSLMINGKKVTPKRESDSLDEIIAAKYQDLLNDHIGSLRCSEHNLPPQIIGVGKDIDNINFEVSACCEKFKAEVEAKLADLKQF